MRFAILLLSIAFPLTAPAADVYRCVNKGVTTYQDFPCGAQDAGKGVRVAVPDNAPARSGQEEMEALRKNVDTMARQRRQRELATQIQFLERSLAGVDKEEAAELDVLRQKRGYAANNFIADGWDRNRVDRALADEMATVSAKYRQRTDPVRRQIDDLQKELKTLSAPPAPAAPRPPDQ